MRMACWNERGFWCLREVGELWKANAHERSKGGWDPEDEEKGLALDKRRGAYSIQTRRKKVGVDPTRSKGLLEEKWVGQIKWTKISQWTMGTTKPDHQPRVSLSAVSRYPVACCLPFLKCFLIFSILSPPFPWKPIMTTLAARTLPFPTAFVASSAVQRLISTSLCLM